MLFPRLVRRRKAWLMCLAALVAVCFIFQFLGIHLLSSGARKMEQTWYEQNKPRGHIRPAIIGVRPSDLPLYKPDLFGRVFCRDLSIKLPFSRINDDFCDCPSDGSDEPGTDACPNGRFYCLHDKRFIPSGKVNDGICDCCDGSEEWNQTISLQKVKGFPHSSRVRVAPCDNTCEGVPNQVVGEEKMKQLGGRLKKMYLKAGWEHIGEIYGDNGEYYTLSLKCFEHFQDHSQYTVCPFRHIIQQKSDRSYHIGKWPSWDENAKADGIDILVMGNGDKRMCPGDAKRKTYIHFVCGLKDEVISVREKEACVYALRFTTPAAC